VVMGLLYVVLMGAGGLREYFELDLPPAWLWGPVCAAVVVGGAAIVALPRFVHSPRWFAYRRSSGTGLDSEQVDSEPVGARSAAPRPGSRTGDSASGSSQSQHDPATAGPPAGSGTGEGT
ncbi:MAG: hypothetical protein OXE75_08715, partial [bacterium]|nr:hypothetical protein [bacterium]